MKVVLAKLCPFLLLACGEGSLDPEADIRDAFGTEDRDADGSEPLVDTPEPPKQISSSVDGDVERPDAVQSTGFFTHEGRLYDAFGNDFVIRGVNNAHAWFDPGRDLALGALDNISDYGFNSVRIVWEAAGAGTTPSLLRRIFSECIEHQMIPMLELHDATGSRSNEDLLELADYLVSEDIAQILKDYEQYLLINLANEWSGGDFFGGYSAAIHVLRDAGIHHTLVIDANGWGQNVDVIFEHGEALLEEDPQHNLLFSTHMYESFSTNSRILSAFERARDQQLPFIVGEFGWQHGRPPAAIDAGYIFEVASVLGFGHMPWSWKGNSADVEYLDMAVDWEGGQLTDWGTQVVEHEFGVRNTAMRASVFVLSE